MERERASGEVSYCLLLNRCRIARFHLCVHRRRAGKCCTKLVHISQGFDEIGTTLRVLLIASSGALHAVLAGDIRLIQDANDCFEPREGSTLDHAVEIVGGMNGVLVRMLRTGASGVRWMSLSIA